MLFLTIPKEGKIFRLCEKGKEEVRIVPLPQLVSYKLGGHMLNFTGRYDIEPSEINRDYYDGGSDSYTVLEGVLEKKPVEADFEALVKSTGQMLNLNVQATVILACDRGGMYRLTYRPTPGGGMIDCYKFEIRYLFDDCRIAPHCELKEILERKQAAEMDSLNKLFDPTELNHGINTMHDFFPYKP